VTLIELLAQTGPLVSGAVGVGGGIVAGAVGGWISTWATNRATRQRQASDHEHTKNLADARVQAETTAALRADRARLYTDIYDAHSDAASYFNEFDLTLVYDGENYVPPPKQQHPRAVKMLGTPMPWEIALHQRSSNALHRHVALQGRVALLAPRAIRHSYSAMHHYLKAWNRATDKIAAGVDPDEWPDCWAEYGMLVLALDGHTRLNFDDPESQPTAFGALLEDLCDAMRADILSPTLEA